MRDRDAALEKILERGQLAITEIAQEAFSKCMQVLISAYPQLLSRRQSGYIISDVIRSLDLNMDRIMHDAAHRSFFRALDLRKRSYILSNVGQAEAIGRATGKTAQYHVPNSKVLQITHSKLKGGYRLEDRFLLAYSKVRRDLIHAIETSLSMEEDDENMRIRLYKALPKRRVFSQTPNALKKTKKPLKEARADEPSITMSTGFVNDDDWCGLVDDYLDEHIPDIRGPEDFITINTPKGVKNVYGWELERDVNQAFVEDVRSGQVDAANSNGIIDFVWVAVLDDRTEAFDAWADGRLTSEIETAIERGDAPESEYETSVPPAHFNCRCTLAPATDELIDQIPQSNLGDFDAWLNT